MEFPSLGQHCSDSNCRQLDFLPVKCDSCKKTYCMDHYSYVKHNCPTAFAKDVQVPVCPLCNALVPGKSDELPDIRVSRHIDADCKSDKAVNRRTVYTNKCSVKGCKQKELIPVLCEKCTNNFCLRHRHPQDHTCSQATAKPIGKAGMAAALRNNHTTSSSSSDNNNSRARARSMVTSVTNGFSNMVSGGRSHTSQATPYAASASTLQGNMSEDAALQLALKASMSESGVGARSSASSTNTNQQPLSQEQEDFLLAKAIAESEAQAARNAPRNNQVRGNNCQIT